MVLGPVNALNARAERTKQAVVSLAREDAAFARQENTRQLLACPQNPCARLVHSIPGLRQEARDHALAAQGSTIQTAMLLAWTLMNAYLDRCPAMAALV